MRDYPGSTLYTESELEALAKPELQASALQARAMELAAFIHWFIETEDIPPIAQRPGSDGLTGGLSLVGWSAGNLQTLTLLAHAAKVPEKTRTLLDSYFRSFFIYAANHTALGEPAFEGLYSPFRDPTLTSVDAIVDRFLTWISSYYPQEELAGEPSALGKKLIARASQELHVTNPSVDPRWTPTVSRMSSDELKSITDNDALLRSQILLEGIQPSVYKEIIHSGLLDCYLTDESGTEKMIWPQLKVKIIWCDMDVGDVLWAAYKLRGISEEFIKKHGKGRSLEVLNFEKTNHFAHWDEPQRFTEFIASVV
ncbi:hypothetical protein BV22DRAFT_1030006 [Leucogyrophana mollusca]|uniref:Uncharacterized protein n=1 Tax=Leucogyrophana mollusca TaxID=85980 RepID=A0ACB8BUA6_9AGAM|nr:hypothetical protein BV22DRAFT_1030006 [Leucogyrophana mollusca]